MTHAGKVLVAGDYIGRDNDLKVVWSTGKDDRPRPAPKAEPKGDGIPEDVKRELATMEVPF
jgi:hypothetical protein